MDLSAYLDRIDYQGDSVASRETLRALHLAQVLAVPFETLDGYRGVPVSLKPADLFGNIVTGEVSAESFGGRG